MIGGKEINALIQRDNAMYNLDAQLDAWGIDADEFRAVITQWGEIAAPRYADIPAPIALGLAWGGGFLIGYAARLEVEAESAAEEAIAAPDSPPASLLREDGPDEDNEVHERPECQRCSSDTYAEGTLSYEGCSDCKEADSE